MHTWAECCICSQEATQTIDYEQYCDRHTPDGPVATDMPKAVACHVCRHCKGAITWNQDHEPADDLKCWCWLPRNTVRRLWVRTATSCHPPSGMPRAITKAEARRKHRAYLELVANAVGEGTP